MTAPPLELGIVMERGWLEHAAMRHTLRSHIGHCRQIMLKADHAEVSARASLMADQAERCLAFVDSGTDE